jgi:hypothetical protein
MTTNGRSNMYRFDFKVTYGPNDVRIESVVADTLEAACRLVYEPGTVATCLGSVDLTAQGALAFPPSERDLNAAWGV